MGHDSAIRWSEDPDEPNHYRYWNASEWSGQANVSDDGHVSSFILKEPSRDWRNIWYRKVLRIRLSFTPWVGSIAAFREREVICSASCKQKSTEYWTRSWRYVRAAKFRFGVPPRRSGSPEECDLPSTRSEERAASQCWQRSSKTVDPGFVPS